MKSVVILPNSPCLGDICIPIARIRAAMEIFAPYNPEFEPEPGEPSDLTDVIPSRADEQGVNNASI